MTYRTTTMRRNLTLAGVIASVISLAGPAYAGSCPADKMRPDGSGEKMNSTPAKDVTDAVLTSIDLAKEPAAVKDRLLRLRRLEIKSGGVVPWHSTPTVRRSSTSSRAKSSNMPAPARCRSCTAPATSRPRRMPPRIGGRIWATETVVLLSADFFPVAASDQHMM